MQGNFTRWLTWMKIEGSGLLLASATWAAVMLFCLLNWFNDNADIDLQTLSPTTINLVLVLSLFLLFMIGFILSGDVFTKRWKNAANHYGLWISGLATAALCTIFHFGLIGILVIIIAGQLPRFYSLKTSLIVAYILPILGATIGYYASHLPYLFENALLFSLFNTFAVMSSHRFIKEQTEKLKSVQLIRELKATQLLLSNTSKRDERLRVARDLHDSLGHNLTALSLQLEVASHKDVNQIKPHIQQAKAIADSLLSDVRKTLSDMRENEDFQLDEALILLTQDIPNLAVELKIGFNSNKLNIRLATVIFRCVQEAITNVMKHTKATQCLVNMYPENKKLLLTIKDNGQFVHDIHFGNGLQGMLERVNQLDGTLLIENLPDGCQLTISFPFVALQI